MGRVRDGYYHRGIDCVVEGGGVFIAHIITTPTLTFSGAQWENNDNKSHKCNITQHSWQLKKDFPFRSRGIA